MSRRSSSPWPTMQSALDSFFLRDLIPPIEILKATASQGGSGRPMGSGRGVTKVVPLLSLGALEAGLEDMLLAAHGMRLRQSHMYADDRRYLARDLILSPSPDKVERVYRTLFGVTLAQPQLPLDTVIRYRLVKKASAKAGSGVPCNGPGTWGEIRPYFKTLTLLRNKVAHGDKIPNRPSTDAFHPNAVGILACPTSDGTELTIQRPHAVSSILLVAAIYSQIFLELNSSLGAIAREVSTWSPYPAKGFKKADNALQQLPYMHERLSAALSP